MGKVWILIVLAIACMKAQTVADLLLPQAKHIQAVVVDSEGQPVPEARIGHTNDNWKAWQTDSEGRFELDTRAPVLVIRKPGFQSEVVRTQEWSGSRVTLRKQGRRLIPICPAHQKYVSVEGWNAALQFPMIPGVKVGDQRHDVDYGVRNYYIATSKGRKAILHGSGPLWSFGTPLDRDVWRSTEYDEAIYDAGTVAAIDARGKFSNGNKWRSLGRFGESASYSDVDEATAELFDRMLDGVCLKEKTPLIR